MILSSIATATAVASFVVASPVSKPFLGVQWMHGQNPSNQTLSSNAQNMKGYHVTYWGGPLLSNLVVKPIYWSTNVLYNYDAFYSASATGTLSSPSPFMALLTEYSQGTYNVGGGSSSVGIVNVAGASSGTVMVSAVESYITSLSSSGALDPSGGSLYVPVHFASGVTVNDDTGPKLGNSCTTWCAFHYSVNTPKGWIYYGILPEMSFGNCARGCGFATNTIFANNCLVASHELAEAVTDADQGQNGWNNFQSGEIGDICNAQPSTFCGADGYQYAVQKEWSNAKNACVGPANAGQPCPKGPATGGGGSGSMTTTTTTSVLKSSTTTAASSVKPSTTTNATVAKSSTTTTLNYTKSTSTTTTTTSSRTTTAPGAIQGSPCTTFGGVQCVNKVQYQCAYWTSSGLTWGQWGTC
ncbi:UNVERIFIED_CONTAM: hypothetical protein HDU68_007635 [Siphonaria sp. JEL0065]|nr:hypothetical protein HDU68_007635 [Siphonaria sp. JEL0065]